MLSLYGMEEARGLLACHLGDVLDLTGADRGALVWIDEYGPGLVHTHCVLDLLSDRPRRAFAIEPLRQAWERGIPGLLDEPDLTSSHNRILTESPRSLAAVALGSDGLRAWFLVVDSKTPRTRFDPTTTDSLMFLAGECASIVIHEDLSMGSGGESVEVGGQEAASRVASRVEVERRSRFPGWPVLQDASESAPHGTRDQLVTLRFLAARLLRELEDDDFAVEADAFSERIDAVRREMREMAGRVGAERWEELFDALEGDDYSRLAGAVLELGVEAEKEGHFHGARELHRLAYGVAVAGAHGACAVDAARFLGRVSRRLGSWDESQRWYEGASEIARVAGMQRGEALALDGLGNTYRERGALPDARNAYLQVLRIGAESDDRDLHGRAHHSLALVEKHAGRTDEALRHAWAAVDTFEDRESFYRALADLGELFIRCGELESADQALRIVADSGCGDRALRAGATELLAHVGALRRDRTQFQRYARKVSFDGVGLAAQAEIFLYRGKSFLALNDSESARAWFEKSLEFAEEHGVTRVLFEAEDALLDLREQNGSGILKQKLPDPKQETMAVLRGSLAAVGAGAGSGGSASVPG